MTEIIGIKFKNSGKVYFFAPNGLKFEVGMSGIVETARGVEIGECMVANKEVEDSDVVQPLKPVLRIATEEDLQNQAKNEEKAKAAFKICNEKIAKHNLNMKLIDVEYTFDNSKILFYFIADGRVDFRELVKDLASVFKMRIELRQVGIRDKAKVVGGIGICGRVLCCNANFMEFQPVTIKMAKEQGFSLSPTKISGVCGRLMCCLKYEQDAYEDAIRRMPGIGSLVSTEKGKGVVTAVNLLKETVMVKYENEEEEQETVKLENLTVIKREHGKAAPTLSMGDEGDINSIVD